MRIAHLLGAREIENPDGMGLGGVRVAALEIARAQARRGHDVWVVTLGARRRAGIWNGVKLVTLPIAPWARIGLRQLPLDFSLHLPYVLFARQRQLDIVHGHEYAYMRFLRAGQRLVHFHSDPYWSGGFGEGFDFKPGDFESVRRNSQAQLAVSQFIAGQLERGLAGGGNVQVVYNGVDAERFDGERHADDAAGLRAAWGAAPDDVVFLFSGAIAPEKGVTHLARAFARLARRETHVHLVLAGSSSMLAEGGVSGEYERRVHEILAPLQQQGRVHFLGRVAAAEMPAVYAASDGVVVPSVCQEGFSLVAVEALATGRPVIASASGGLLETVTPEVGLRVVPGDELELEAAMATLATDPAEGRRLGAAGRAHARRFTWDDAAQTIDAVVTARRPQLAYGGS